MHFLFKGKKENKVRQKCGQKGEMSEFEAGVSLSPIV